MINSGYYRFPTIYKTTIVFVSEDDLWGVSTKGGVAWRLTSNLGAVTHPTFSPDGKQIAFVGREEGAPEVYVMPAEGGTARRLTYLGSGCRVLGWNQAGTHILFCSSYGQVIWREYGLYQVAVDGTGEMTELPYGPARSIAVGPKNEVVIGRNTGDPARWKRYRGGTAGHLWVCKKKNEFVHLLPDLSGNIASPMWVVVKGRNRIFFVSDHEGVGNLYSCSPAGKGLKRHTDHEEFYVRNPSTDGSQIVYHAGADLYIYDVAKDKSKRVKVDYRSPRVQRNRKFVSATRSVSEASMHPSSQALTAIMRGKAFTMYNHEGPVYQHGQRDGVRYRLPSWLNDGGRLLLISDEQGEETLEIHSTQIDDVPQSLDGLDIGRPLSIKVSPTADHIALTNHRQELLLIELNPKKSDEDQEQTEADDKSKKKKDKAEDKSQNQKKSESEESDEVVPVVTVVDRSPYRRVSGFDWSPDGRWIAYGCSVSEHATSIKLYRLAEPEAEDETLRESAIHTITNPVLHDTSPAFDPEGRYLYFLSSREFNPVYDALHFDLSFPWGMRPYLLTLSNDLPNPFVPRPEFSNGQPAEPPADEDEEEPEDEETPEDSDAEETPEDSDDDDGGDDESDDADEDDNKDDSEDVTTGERLLAHDSTESKVTSSANGEKEEPDAEKEKAPKRPQIRIDLEGIQQRVLAFPVPDAQYGQIAGIKGKAIFTVFPTSGSLDSDYDWDQDVSSSGTLRVYDFNEYKADTLVDGLYSFGLSRDRKKMIYFSGRRLRVINAGEKAPANTGPSRKSGWIDLSRAKVSIDRPSEWQQMMREAWRLQRDHFWSEDMSQVDWQAVYERYYPLIDRINSRAEFSDLMWEMQGELGTSHAYEYGGDHRRNPAYYGQGFLGTTFTWSEEEKGYIVGELVRGDSWNQWATSPLSAPGMDIKPGDVVIGINGQRLDAETWPEMLLVNQAGVEVLLTLKTRAEEGDADKEAENAKKKSGGKKSGSKKQSKAAAKAETKAATEAIVPTVAHKKSAPEYRSVTAKALYTESTARYRAWVESNRRTVHEATDGKVGYVHIPDMGARGYAEFHRGFLAESDRDGLIVDVRYNGGGNVSQLILEKLSRQRLGYDMPRWGEAIPYPRDSAAGPMVALTNEQAGSDGDIFSHGFKMMKLGPLIGKRTWGGVIGIWPRHALVDGTVTTQPEFSFWFEDVGWGIENYGTNPDIEVDITPQDYAAGVDSQLDRAIKEVLRLIKKNKVKKPALENRPKLPLPKLPPRKK